MKILNLLKEDIEFFVLLAVILSFRILFLFHFRYIDFEDANIALMAKDILNATNMPIYAYGVPYNAGEVVDALVLAILFRFFGISGLVIKILALIEGLLLVVAVYFVSKRVFNQGSAFLGALLFSLSPSIMVWNYYLRGYLIDTLFYFLVFHLFMKTQEEFNNHKNIFLFGLLSGLTFWMKELVIILICCSWLFLLVKYKNNIYMLFRNLTIYFLFFIIGYLPSIIYNLTNDFLNWKRLLKGGTGLFYILSKYHSAGDIINRFIVNPIYSTMIFFEPYNDLGTPASINGIIHWAIHLLIFTLTILLLWKGKDIKQDIKESHFFILKFIIVYLSISFLFLLLGFSEPVGIIGVRFYVLLYPLWIMFISYVMFILYYYGGWVRKLFILILLFIMIGLSLFKHFEVYKNDFLIKEYEYAFFVKEGNKEKTSYPVIVRAKSIEEIINFLKDHNIKFVFTTLTFKMRLIVESGFNLCIASYGYYPLGDPYPECRDEVLNSRQVAVVLLKNSPHIVPLENALKREDQQYLKILSEDYVIFYPVDMTRLFKK